MNIKKQRESKGISLRFFARVLAISPTHLSRIECGHNVPSERVARGIAKGLELDVDETLASFGILSSDLHGYLIRNRTARNRVRAQMRT